MKSLYALWDEDLYEQFCRETVEPLADERLREAYLTLGRELIGRGYLTRARRPVLARLLCDVLPQELPHAQNPMELLAQAWNLGERLLEEPPWLEDMLQAAWPADFKKIPALLDSLTAPLPPATWQGPYTQNVLDPRALLPDFLPGEMWLAAPRLLCVQDRRLNQHVGVLLRGLGQSTLLTLHQPPPPLTSEGPPIHFQDGCALVAERHVVPLPFLAHVHTHALTHSGFILASAVDSQRLWVVDTP